jgi:hypothetical protein
MSALKQGYHKPYSLTCGQFQWAQSRLSEEVIPSGWNEALAWAAARSEDYRDDLMEASCCPWQADDRVVAFRSHLGIIWCLHSDTQLVAYVPESAYWGDSHATLDLLGKLPLEDIDRLYLKRHLLYCPPPCSPLDAQLNNAIDWSIDERLKATFDPLLVPFGHKPQPAPLEVQTQRWLDRQSTASQWMHEQAAADLAAWKALVAASLQQDTLDRSLLKRHLRDSPGGADGALCQMLGGPTDDIPF